MSGRTLALNLAGVPERELSKARLRQRIVIEVNTLQSAAPESGYKVADVLRRYSEILAERGVNASPSTLRRWQRRNDRDDLAGLIDQRTYGRRPPLADRCRQYLNDFRNAYRARANAPARDRLDFAYIAVSKTARAQGLSTCTFREAVKWLRAQGEV